MLREITQILMEVCNLLTYAWTGIGVDQSFNIRSPDDRPTDLWRAARRPWPLERHDKRPHGN